MATILNVISASLVLFTNCAFCQIDRSSLIKGGAFLYVLESKFNGYSIHLEYEKTLKNKEFLTAGPRLDYTEFKHISGALMIAYDLKLYPFYWISKKPYHGMFIGADLTYLIQHRNIATSRYGPGIGSLFGYQYVLKDKVSLCLEGSMIYMQDMNENAPQYNPEHRYLYVFACLKAGIKINKKENAK